MSPPDVLTRARSRGSVRAWLDWVRGTGVHGVWIALWSIIAWGATPIAPLLLDVPVALMLLTPRAAFVLLAAPKLDLTTFIMLGTLRLSITDASWFIVGRRFPDAAPKLRLDPRGWWYRLPLRWSRLACRWITGRPLLAGTFLFLRPTGRYLGVAGANGVCGRLAGICSVVGTVVYLALVHAGLATVF